MWAFAFTTRTFGRFTDLDPDRLLAASEELARSAPEHRFFRRVDPASRHWIRPAPGEHRQVMERAVLRLPAMPPEELHRRMADLYLGDLPWRFAIAGDLIAFRLRHLLGDGSAIGQLVAGLTIAAQTGRFPSSLAVPSPRHPVARAVAGQARLLRAQALTGALRARAEGPVGEIISGPAGLDQRAAYVTAAASLAGDLAAARGSGPDRPSIGGVLLSRLRLALMAEGITVSPTTPMLFGIRRYLPDGVGSVVDGNFAVPLPVRAADPDDPAAISRAIRETTDSGLPVLAVARGAALSWRLDLAKGPTVRRFAEPLLVHSLLPSEPLFAEMHRVPEAEPVLIVTAPPAGVRAISVNTSLVGDRIQLCASYYTRELDEGAVHRALARVAQVAADRVGCTSVTPSLSPGSGSEDDARSSGPEADGRSEPQQTESPRLAG